MKPDKEPGLLEAIFDIDPGRESLLEELMAPVPTASASAPGAQAPAKSRWRNTPTASAPPAGCAPGRPP